MAPVNGAMDRRIAESIDADMDVALLTPHGVFGTKGHRAGMEVVGPVKQLVPVKGSE